MDARLDTCKAAYDAVDAITKILQPLPMKDRARAMLLVALDLGPGFVSDEALLRLCHEAQQIVMKTARVSVDMGPRGRIEVSDDD